MKSILTLCAATGMLILFSAASQAQTGTAFTPPIGTTGGTGAQNPDGSYVHPTGLAQDGNPLLFHVGGSIAEYVEIKAIDDQLELGNLGGPQNKGWVASVNPSGNTGVLAGEAPATTGTPSFVTQTTGNGTAGLELDSNAYITVEANYGADISNPGPTASPADDFTIPTRYRVSARGREFRFGNLALQGSTAGYTGYQTSVGSGNSSKVTFSPGYTSGIKIMSEVQRDGLNNYRGTYTSTIAMNYFKF